MAKFTVDRKTWYRGKGAESSRLLCENGMRCCIGFVAQQCGIPDDVISNRPDIRNTHLTHLPWPEWFLSPGFIGLKEAFDLTEAYRLNDHTTLTDDERETQLIELFARHGDTIEFIN